MEPRDLFGAKDDSSRNDEVLWSEACADIAACEQFANETILFFNDIAADHSTSPPPPKKNRHRLSDQSPASIPKKLEDIPRGIMAQLYWVAGQFGFSTARSFLFAIGDRTLLHTDRMSTIQQAYSKSWHLVNKLRDIVLRLRVVNMEQKIQIDDMQVRMQTMESTIQAMRCADNSPSLPVGADLASAARAVVSKYNNSCEKQELLRDVEHLCKRKIPVTPHLLCSSTVTPDDERFRMRANSERSLRKHCTAETRNFLQWIGRSWGLPHEPFKALGYQMAAPKTDRRASEPATHFAYGSRDFVKQLLECSPHKLAFQKGVMKKPAQRKQLFRRMWASAEEETMAQVCFTFS